VTGAVRLTGSLVTPAGALLAVLGPAIGVLLFGSTATGADGGFLLGLTLAGFMVGLPFYSAYYVVMRGFYSLEDTRVPALNAVLVNAISIAAGLTAYVVLPDRFVVPGLALAFSLGYVVGVAVLWRQLRVRLSGLNTGEVLRAFRPIVAASVLAAVVAFVTAAGFRVLGGDWPTTLRALVQVVIGGLLGSGLYLWLARRWRIDDVQVLVRTFRRRFRPA